MRRAMKICNAVYWLALTIWVAALVSGGVAAAGVFSTLPKLGILLPKYQPALGTDTAEHGRLAGGMVMEPVFTAMDWVQVAAVVFVTVALALQFTVFRMRITSSGHLIRAICIGGAALVMIVQMATIAPRMNRELRGVWNAVDDRAAMESHRTAFESDHHVANSLYTTRLILLLAGVAVSGAVLGTSRTGRSALEMPRLLRVQ
jgi:hypothetical protein